jgi:transglutaminase-like putative cysteine protease
VSLLLEQHICYEYSSPVERLRQRLIVVPPAVHGAQRRTDSALTVTCDDGGATARRTRTDRFGNVVIEVAAPRVRRCIEFTARAAVEFVSPEERPVVAGDAQFVRPTRLTAADERVDALAAPEASPRELCARTYRSLAYEWGVTGIHTTAAEALRLGLGVCQDFAHVMIAACRAAGIAARYVSGHLVGEGGSHAWVEVLRPDPARPGWCTAEAWDPTHDRPAGDGYVTVAVGRDYADVAPLSGSYVANRAVGRLSVTKRVVSGESAI